MKVVLQRVKEAKVEVAGETVGRIDAGLMILAGVGRNDTARDADYLAQKIVNLRIFEDQEGKMNRSLIDIQGQALIVSQFTLWGDCRKGRRPSFGEAAPPEIAQPLYLELVQRIAALGIPVATGRFGAEMQVHLVNDGPVTLILES